MMKGAFRALRDSRSVISPSSGAFIFPAFLIPRSADRLKHSSPLLRVAFPPQFVSPASAETLCATPSRPRPSTKCASPQLQILLPSFQNDDLSHQASRQRDKHRDNHADFNPHCHAFLHANSTSDKDAPPISRILDKFAQPTSPAQVRAASSATKAKSSHSLVPAMFQEILQHRRKGKSNHEFRDHVRARAISRIQRTCVVFPRRQAALQLRPTEIPNASARQNLRGVPVNRFLRSGEFVRRSHRASCGILRAAFCPASPAEFSFQAVALAFIQKGFSADAQNLRGFGDFVMRGFQRADNRFLLNIFQ